MAYQQCRKNNTLKNRICRMTTTSQQFILKEYLASSPPDLFVLFGNGHDLARYTMREYAMNVRTLADMFDVYMTNKTKVIWTTKPAVYIRKITAAMYANGTVDVTDLLKAANRIHFQELRKNFVEKFQLLMFLDLYGISAPVVADWSLDGVHMQPIWYKHIVSQLLQILCEMHI